MQRLGLAITLGLLVAGCASEAERCQWNLAHVFVCPRARWLTHPELDQIARAVAHASPQVAAVVMPPANDDSRRILLVDTVYRGAEQSEDRNNYGWCKLERSGGTWRVVECYTDSDPGLWHMSHCP
jgi:hypothetical protein